MDTKMLLNAFMCEISASFLQCRFFFRFPWVIDDSQKLFVLQPMSKVPKNVTYMKFLQLLQIVYMREISYSGPYFSILQ